MSIRSEVIRIINELLSQAKKITDLPAGTTPLGGEFLEAVQGGVSVKLTVSQVASGGVGVLSVVAGTGITVDDTDPQNPIVSALGGGSGTVTSFSAGNLSPLFTTSVATATTTPALTFALSSQSANLVFAGPTSGGAAGPTFRSLVVNDIPSLSSLYVAVGSTAGGELSGTYPNPTLVNASVIGKVLTGYTSGAGTVSATDSILQAIQKLNGNISALPTGSGAANRVAYWTGAAALGSSSTFLFDGTNLGVGATPQSLLTVSRQTTIQAPVSGSTAQFVGLDANPLRITFDTHNNANASGTAFMFRRSRGTSTTPSALSADDVIAAFSGRGYGTTQYAAASTGLINIKANQTFTDANNGTYISFDVTPDNSVTAAEAFRINGNKTLTAAGYTTSGGVLYTNGSGLIGQEANFFWDSTNHILGVGTNSLTSTTRATIKGLGTSTNISFVVTNSTPTNSIRVLDNTKLLGGATASTTGQWVVMNSSSATNIFEARNSSDNLRVRIAENGTTVVNPLSGPTFTWDPSGYTGVYLSTPVAGNTQIFHSNTNGESIASGGITSAININTKIGGTINNTAGSGNQVIGLQILWTETSLTGTTLYGIRQESANALSSFGHAAPTALLHIGAVTTARASLCINPGSTTTAPSSPVSGDIWHEGTGNRLMFRQGSTSVEVLGASAVTTEVVVSDTTLTIKYNNTTLKLLARA